MAPSRVEPAEELHDLPALARVEVAGRLVGEEQLRAGNDGAGHRDELLLAAGELAGKEVLLADQLEAVERVADERGPLGGRRTLR